jgi:excisionase family DNA binding protein
MEHLHAISSDSETPSFDTARRQMRSTESRLDALEKQVEWLTEQVQARLVSTVPVKMALSVAELAARWGRSRQTIRRMVKRGEIRLLRARRPFDIPMSEVYRLENLHNPRRKDPAS